MPRNRMRSPADGTRRRSRGRRDFLAWLLNNTCSGGRLVSEARTLWPARIAMMNGRWPPAARLASRFASIGLVPAAISGVLRRLPRERFDPPCRRWWRSAAPVKHRQLQAGQLFDAAHQRPLGAVAERNRDACGASPRGAADPGNIG